MGNLLYYRFMNPAVVAPDGFDIVDISAGVTLHPDHRRSLGSIAKVLQHAAARKAFDGENAHLCGVNRYLEDTYHKFRWALGWHRAGRAAGGRWKGLGLTAEVPPPRRFIAAACCVPEPEERFNVDEYSEMVAVAKPVIYITVGELINTHKVRESNPPQRRRDHLLCSHLLGFLLYFITSSVPPAQLFPGPFYLLSKEII